MNPLETRVQVRAEHDEGPKFEFGKSRRLLKASEFNRVFKLGRRQSVPELTLAFRLRPMSKGGRGAIPRLGLSVSRKAGASVQRNLLKRRIREIFRLNQKKLLEGTELVVIPRKEAGLLSYFELEKKVFSLLDRAKLTKRDV